MTEPCFECRGRGWVADVQDDVEIPAAPELGWVAGRATVWRWPYRTLCTRCNGTGREREPMPGEGPDFLRRLMKR
jgi:hypothetical protein